MSVLTKVGSFAKNTATGTQAITGVGFTPKAIIFWTTVAANSASGTWSAFYRASIGFTTGASNSYSCAAASSDAVATSATARRMAAKCITMQHASGSSAQVDEADLTSFDSDGFTINWTLQGIAGASQICYLAIGGSDITGANVVTWFNTTTGVKAVTGVGFKPDLVLTSTAILTAMNSSGTSAYLSLGAMNKHGQQWAESIFAASAVNPANTTRYQQTDAAVVTGDASESIFQQGHFVSMDTDGFSLNYSVYGAPSAFLQMGLCLQGLSSKIGAFPKTVASAPAAQSIARVGFTPRAVLTASTDAAASSAPVSSVYWELGATDGTNSRLVEATDVDAVSPTQVDAVFYNDRLMVTSPGNGGAITSSGTLTSMDADGFSLSFNPNSATATEVCYLALGDAGVNTFPSMVG